MNKVVYTILLGDYQLNEPEYINSDWDHICFTNWKHNSKNWSIIQIDECNNLRKKAREIKIRYDRFLDFDICLYFDAKFTIKCDLNNFVEENLKANIAVMKHNKRSCAYDEAKFCINLGIDNKDIITKQILSYQNDGFPVGFGLYGTGILIRKNSPEVIKFMKMWYDEIKKHSCRDQISFSYVLWKYPIEISSMSFKETYKRFV